MADAAASSAADGAAAAPAPSAAELLEAEVWLLATPAQQYKAFLRVFELVPAAHANRESLIQEQMFNVVSEMRSFKHTPPQTMVVFAILSKIFDLFEDPLHTKGEVEASVVALVRSQCVAPLFGAVETNRVADFFISKFVGARFSLLQQALHLSVAEFQQRAARLREQQAAIDAAAAAAAAEAAAGTGETAAPAT